MITEFLTSLRTQQYSKHTLLAYQTDLEQFEAYWALLYAHEARSIATADFRDIRTWILTLSEQKCTKRSINRKIATLRTFFTYLEQRGMVAKSPMKKIKNLKKERDIPHFLTENDMKNLLDELPFDQNFEGQRDKIVVELLYGTGIRREELLSIKRTDIDFSRAAIKIQGKKNKQRLVPLVPSLLEALRKFLDMTQHSTSPMLITTDKDEAAYPMLIYRIVKKYVSMVSSIDKRSPHVLRHTFATHLLNNGADLAAIKDLLGHESLAATQIYTHNTTDKLRKVFEKAHPKA